MRIEIECTGKENEQEISRIALETFRSAKSKDIKIGDWVKYVDLEHPYHKSIFRVESIDEFSILAHGSMGDSYPKISCVRLNDHMQMSLNQEFE